MTQALKHVEAHWCQAKIRQSCGIRKTILGGHFRPKADIQLVIPWYRRHHLS